MNETVTTALGILVGILGISLLVVVHELGHYLTARWLGMRVERFSIGLGPTLFKYRPKNSPTTFQICAIPVLAYVQIAGMNPFEEIDRSDPELFPNKNAFARIVVILGGPVANYLFASLVVFGLVLASDSGYPMRPVEPVTVSDVQEGSPAAAAGLQEGDVILRGNGQAIEDFIDLKSVTTPRGGQPTEYVIQRNGREMTVTITPEDAEGGGMIGVSTLWEPWYQGWRGAVEGAFVVPFVLTVEQLSALSERFSACSSEGLTGPKGMVEKAAEAAQEGAAPYLHILMLISVALGLFNLLPFPALDGGRFVFLAYEVITRKRPNERFEAMVHTVGILFLLGVIALVTYREIVG